MIFLPFVVGVGDFIHRCLGVLGVSLDRYLRAGQVGLLWEGK